MWKNKFSILFGNSNLLDNFCAIKESRIAELATTIGGKLKNDLIFDILIKFSLF